MKKKLMLNKESLRNLTSNEMGHVAGGDTLTNASIIFQHPPIVIPNPLSIAAGGCGPTSTLHDRLSPIAIVIGS